MTTSLRKVSNGSELLPLLLPPFEVTADLVGRIVQVRVGFKLNTSARVKPLPNSENYKAVTKKQRRLEYGAQLCVLSPDGELLTVVDTKMQRSVKENSHWEPRV